ncbi:MAG TPA: RsmD family RNA methyltransferase, partial [Xanthomonadales bacterium]|nr:RsmD family RNA methyltransferase [Xanthomonadales bacterium]
AQIVSAGQRLNIAERMHVSRIAAERLLATLPDARFDIAFVDPPYNAGLWTRILERLPAWLKPGALVYLEHPVEIPPPFGSEWLVRKHSSAGRVSYCLLEHAPGSASVSDQNPAESAP